jgi:formylglycine-generating enzyme required for sulfatase activity
MEKFSDKDWSTMRTGIFYGLIIYVSIGAFANAETGNLSTEAKTVKPAHTESHSQKCFTNTIGQTFLYIKPGSFLMGSPQDEPGRSKDEPQHRVTLTKGYYMQTTEVTQGQWRMVMEKNPAYFQDCGDLCPVETLSWNDVQKFIHIMNQRPGTYKYRLPTEAEWEYAARAGTTGPFASSSLDSMAWHRDNSGDTTHPVGMKAPNAWALYDMHDNVSEWVQDWYRDYPVGSVTDPTVPSSGFYRVNRGGGWDMPFFGCRSAQRIINGPGSMSPTLGFRLVAEGSP